MIEPFKSFAKGYVRYMQGLIPLSNQQSRLGALRALEQAVRRISGAAGVELIDIHCLNRAAELIKEHWSETAAYRIGGQLEAIADFLTDNRLTRTPVKWRNPLSRPSDTERIGEAADKRRQERLPSPRALEAVAIAFNTATAPADVIIASAAALKRVKDMVGGDEEFFGALEPVRPHAPTLRAEFARLAIKTAHTTDFGYCIHDFVMAPCELHADCLNCVEHVCVKGDAAKTVAVRQRFEEAKMLLARAATAVAQGFHGANRWEDHHRLTAERLEHLLTVLDDPSVPSGSLVRMADLHSASRIAQAGAARARAHGNRTEPPDRLDRLAFEWEEEDA